MQGYQQQPYAPPMPPGSMPGYYGRQPLTHRLRQRMEPIETKPFYLTSEFGVSLLAAILIAITAASSHAFGAWRAWILITALVVAYSVSRGIAKAGTRSHASDPREHLDFGRGHGSHHVEPGHHDERVG